MQLLKSITQEIPTRRRGTTILELIAAGAILGVLLVVCAQMLSRTVVQQQAIGNRRAALQMASNAMERARLLPWDELNADAGRAIAEAVLEQRMLRRSRLAVTIEEPESKPVAKRIHVVVSWSEGTDGAQRKQQLTAWRYQAGAGTVVDSESARPLQSPEEVP